MRINTNIAALMANSQLSRNENNLSKSLERLSSGKKINRSADDAAGMAISQKMKTQIRGLDRASQNASDGISVVQTAEGALNEVQSMLQRMRELAVQGSNETYTSEDRQSVLEEVSALEEEIERISTDTEFNKKTLLNGDLQRRAFADTDGVQMTSFSESVAAGDYGVKVLEDPRQAVIVGDAMNTIVSTDDFSPDAALNAAGTEISSLGAGTVIINGIEVSIESGDSATDVYEKLREAGEMTKVNVFSVSSLANTGDNMETAGYDPVSFAFSSSQHLVFASEEYGSDQEVSISCDNDYLSGLLGITEATATGKDVIATFSTDTDGNRIGFSNTATMSCEGDSIEITDSKGFQMTYKVEGNLTGTVYDDPTISAGSLSDLGIHTAGGDVSVIESVFDIGTMTVQLGANEGQTMEIEIPEVTPTTLGLDKLNFSTSEGCSDAITTLDKAITMVSTIRSQLGAYQNRLESAISSLDVTGENMTAALSRIEDVDMAEEMSTYTQYNVLAQAGTSMLAQANELPQKVLQLLQ